MIPKGGEWGMDGGLGNDSLGNYHPHTIQEVHTSRLVYDFWNREPTIRYLV